MLSFTPVSEENIKNTVEKLSRGLDAYAANTLCEIADSLVFDGSSDTELALCVFENCALIRVFDMGRYFFLFPYELCDMADIPKAINAICEYATREELSVMFADVPCDAFGFFCGFRHITADAEDELAEVYRVRVLNECELAEHIPTVEWGRVKLSALCESDIAEYARLCRDENVNKYWGYDYKCDAPTADDGYFYSESLREFNAGVALCAAIRTSDGFAGEAVLYAFDGRGSADFAIRLLPERQGLGIGRDAAYALMLLAKRLGLIRLHGEIMSENLRSVRLFRKIADRTRENDGKTEIFIDLKEDL